LRWIQTKKKKRAKKKEEEEEKGEGALSGLGVQEVVEKEPLA